MDKTALADFEAFFEKLPRPLPARLEIYPGVIVKDAEAFISGSLKFLKGWPDAAHISWDRLLRWKEGYIAHFSGEQ